MNRFKEGDLVRFNSRAIGKNVKIDGIFKVTLADNIINEVFIVTKISEVLGHTYIDIMNVNDNTNIFGILYILLDLASGQKRHKLTKIFS